MLKKVANKLEFLKSTRFYALVIGAVSLALFQDGLITEAWFQCIATISGGFITIKTVDRVSDKKVEVAKISNPE